VLVGILEQFDAFALRPMRRLPSNMADLTNEVSVELRTRSLPEVVNTD